jgi:polysaccharide transporter, PST family
MATDAGEDERLSSPLPGETGAMSSVMLRLIQHRVIRNAGAMGVVQLVNYATTFLVLIRLTRVLGLTTYGVVAFSVGIVQVLSIVLDLGFTLSATQHISVHRDDKAFVARYVGAVLVVKLAVFMIGACVVALFAATTDKYAAYSLVFVLSLLPLLGQALQPVWFFQGIERMRFVTIFIVIAKLSFVILVWLLVRVESDYLWVPVADGVAQLSAAGTALYLIYRVGYRIARPSLGEVAVALRQTSGFFVSRLSAAAYSYSGVLLLGMVSTPANVAVYALAEQLYRGLHSLFAPVVQALYPYMAREHDFVLLRRVALACIGIALVGGIVGHFLAPVVIPKVLGAKWSASVSILDVFLVAITVHVAAMMSGYPLAAALGRLEVANRSVVYGALIYVALAGLSVLFKVASPVVFAWLLVVSEAYVLLHCAMQMWPAAHRRALVRVAEQQVA